MKVLLAKILFGILTPFYVSGLFIAQIFKANEGMPTIGEWMEMFKNIHEDPEYGLTTYYEN